MTKEEKTRLYVQSIYRYLRELKLLRKLYDNTYMSNKKQIGQIEHDVMKLDLSLNSNETCNYIKEIMVDNICHGGYSNKRKYYFLFYSYDPYRLGYKKLV